MILKPIPRVAASPVWSPPSPHDQVTADDPRPTTDERVAWTATVGGSPTADCRTYNDVRVLGMRVSHRLAFELP